MFCAVEYGDTPVQSSNKMLTTIAYQLDGKPTYALEGSIFVAGAVVQWLRDGLKIIEHAGEHRHWQRSADPMQNVIIVPAFTGLGAPYWNADCRGATFGLTRNSGPQNSQSSLRKCWVSNARSVGCDEIRLGQQRRSGRAR